MVTFRSTFLFTLALTATPAFAQDDLPPVAKPKVPGVGKAARDFVPKGWGMDQWVRGDIDGDGVDDLAIVIHTTDPNLIIKNPDGLGVDVFDSNPRTVIVATYMPGSKMYRRVGQGDDLIPRWSSPTIDDPFGDGELLIDKGAVKLNIRFWANAGLWFMSNTQFSFRYRADGNRPKAIYLVGLEQDEIHRGSGEETWTSINFLTGKMSKTAGSIENDEHSKPIWTNLGRKPLVRLEDMPNGWEFASDFE